MYDGRDISISMHNAYISMNKLIRMKDIWPYDMEKLELILSKIHNELGDGFYLNALLSKALEEEFFRDFVEWFIWQSGSIKHMTRFELEKRYKEAISHENNREFLALAKGGRHVHDIYSNTTDVLQILLTMLRDELEEAELIRKEWERRTPLNVKITPLQTEKPFIYKPGS